MLYFAYGSNLNRRAMAQRCPRAEAVSAARLDGYRLVFRRFADIVSDPTSTVWGALYDLTPACLHALDKYEDAPRSYRKTSVKVVRGETLVDAMAYMMNEGAIAPPELAYYNEIARGYTDWKLDQAHLRRARLAVLTSRKGQDASPKARTGVVSGVSGDAPILRRK